MASSHPIEALLRPPVELMAGIVAIACGFLAGIGPEYFMLTPSVGYGSAIVLMLYGAWWFTKGWGVIAYQRNLRKLSLFEMAPKKIPLSDKHLFLGRGFEWTEKHTQRLHDTRRSRFLPFVQANALVRWVRANEHRWQETCFAKATSWNSALNPVRPLPDGGGNTFLHGVELKEREIYMPLADRRGHTLVLGTTGVGKTRGLEVCVTQDIRRGEIVIVFDPKGDADLLRGIYQTCKDAGRLDDFYMFHLGYPDISSRYNGVGQFHRITEVATRISGQVSGEGASAVFREFVWRFTNIVSKAVVALGQRPDYRTILKHVNAIDELFVKYAEFYFEEDEEVLSVVLAKETTVDTSRQMRHMQGRDKRLIAWDQYLMESGKGDDVLEGLRSAFKYEKSYFDKIVASLLPLLEKLTTGKTAELLSPDYLDLDDDRPIFDWKKVVNQRGVVYVGLDALSDAAVASAVGNSMFADLVSYAGERYKHGDAHGFREGASEAQTRIVLHMDEFNELMGNEFIPMINKGGAAGLHITAYSQTYSDIQAKIGVEAKAKQVSGNFNNLIMFRVRETETAAIMTDQLPTVNVNEITLISGYNDSSDPDSEVDFTSRHEDRISTTQSTMIEPHDLMKQPKGQAFALLEGGRLYKIRLPLAKVNRSTDLNESFLALTRDMRKRYRSSSTWWMTSAGGEGGSSI